MATARQLIEQSTRHQVFLERVKTGEANQFASFLKEIDRNLRLRLSGEDLTSYSRNRLERLIAGINGDLEAIYTRYWDDLSGNLIDIAEYEAEFESRSLNTVLDNFETTIPAPEQVRAAIFSAPLSVRGKYGGKLLEPFIKSWSGDQIDLVSGAVRQGFFEGQTTSQILQVVRGTRANKFRDGLLNVSNRGAGAIVRTAVQHAASVAREQTWRQNSRVVKGVRWVATLDENTTAVCRSLDEQGAVFPIGKGPRPPIHIRCRSTVVAVLDGRFNFLKKGATRSSKDGYVSAELGYYQWLKQQPERFQVEAIGKTRAKLLRNGGLTAERFAELNLGKNFQPLTLKDMKRLEPLAFEKAGL
jgi:SPP1 gp7 family putative phage head morphogenesis protein